MERFHLLFFLFFSLFLQLLISPSLCHRRSLIVPGLGRLELLLFHLYTLPAPLTLLVETGADKARNLVQCSPVVWYERVSTVYEIKARAGARRWKPGVEANRPHHNR